MSESNSRSKYVIFFILSIILGLTIFYHFQISKGFANTFAIFCNLSGAAIGVTFAFYLIAHLPEIKRRAKKE